MCLKNKRLVNISDDYLICRSGNGIYLRPPQYSDSAQDPNPTVLSVSDLMGLPICFYFLNRESKLQKINEPTAKACGFRSLNDAINRNMLDIAQKQSALEVIQTDKYVIEKMQRAFRENIVVRKDGVIKNCLSIKLPWYDDQNKIIGLLGCTLVQGQQPLATSLSLISQLGLLIPNRLASHQDKVLHYPEKMQKNFANTQFNKNYKINLSKREVDCLRLLILGKTGKEVSIYLELSRRTVEHYIENIKSKFDVKRKSELIEKAIEYLNSSL